MNKTGGKNISSITSCIYASEWEYVIEMKDFILLKIIFPLIALLFHLVMTAVAAASDVKISVKSDGIYLITYSNLQNAGFDPSAIDPQHLSMFVQGVEIPIYIYGEEDGIFDTSDYIEFYGTSIPRDSLQFEFTVNNVYWLKTGASHGLRMNIKYGTPSGSGSVPGYFYTTVHKETDDYYWQSLPNGNGKDHWFWGDRIYAPSTKNYTAVLNNISSASANAVVRVSLQGRSDTSVNPDHHTKIYLNGYLIDNKNWDGPIQFLHNVTVPHSYLVNGTNTVRVDSVNDTGAPVDMIHMNWFEIDFYDTFVSENDSLDFVITSPGTYEYRVSNLTTGTAEIFDITDPYNVSRFVNHTIQLNGSTYTAIFEDTVSMTPNRYLILNTSQRKTPAGIITDTPSALKNPSNGADFIIITYDGFYGNILPLANLYQNRGFRVVTAKVTDIYDEFSHGIFDPQAIKSFLEYAYFNWVSPSPLHVLLVGDANIDYKDNFGMGNVNYVPTHLFETSILGQTPSDNWFVSVSGTDILPDMLIGRLSVQSGAQLDGVVNKIMGYKSAQPSDWNKTVQFVSDNEPAFEDLSNNLAANYLPSGFTAKKVYMSQYTSGSNAKKDIKSNFNKGTLITNYTGHGSVDSWAGENMFVTADVSALTNGDKLAFVISLNCLNGFFPLPLSPWQPAEDQTSLAEEFVLRSGKGAFSVFAPTGLGYTSDHNILAQELYGAIFTDNNTVLGSATTQAKISAFSLGASSDIMETFVLFGDPATGLKSQSHTLTVQNTGTGSGSVFSTPPGINCGADCTETYSDNTTVTLTAAPDTGSVFTGWSGDPDCADGLIVMDAGKTCTALFDIQIYTLIITRTGTGSGTVTSSPTGIDCGTECSEDYTSGTAVILTPSPDAGSVFTGWGGNPDCSDGLVAMNDNKNCSAAFDMIQYQLTTHVSQPGSGTVSPDCSGGCLYNSGSIVVLTVNEDNGYPFTGWTGCDFPVDNVCTMIMDAHKDVTALFDSCQFPVKIAGDPPAYYLTLQDAYNYAGDGDTIYVRNMVFPGDLTINRGISSSFKGGYDCTYSAVNGLTSLNGNITISDGTAVIENIKLE